MNLRRLDNHERTGEKISSGHLQGTSGTIMEPSGHWNLGTVRDTIILVFVHAQSLSQCPVALTQLRAEVRPQYLLPGNLLEPTGHRKCEAVLDRILVVSASAWI